MSTTRSAEARIYALAAEQGIVAERLSIDDWADKVTERAGDARVRNRGEASIDGVGSASLSGTEAIR